MLDSGSNKFFTLWNDFFHEWKRFRIKKNWKIEEKKSGQSAPTSWKMYKVHHVMQPHGFEGSFRSRSIKIGHNTAHEVCKWFILMFYCQTLQSVPTSWRMYKVHLVMQPHGFEDSFRSRSMKNCYKTAHEVCKWFMSLHHKMHFLRPPGCGYTL